MARDVFQSVPKRQDRVASPARLPRLGCVSFLNARPLIEGLDDAEDATATPDEPARTEVHFDVPSRLLDRLLAGELDVALCPVIDYQLSPVPLQVLPAGGIGCMGATLTVRLFSQVPLNRIERVYADTDSHTSVNLMRVLLAERFGLRPELVAYHAREHVAGHRLLTRPESVLLIGDKVVTGGFDAGAYPHQMDLGEAWHAWTGLPFVFAVWMCREDVAVARDDRLRGLAAVLRQQRERNAGRIDAIVRRHAAARGWPEDLAKRYLGEMLRYSVGSRELEAMQRFWDLAAKHKLISRRRPLRALAVG